MSIAPAVRTTCPYCGVGCGVLATASSAPSSSGPSSSAPPPGAPSTGAPSISLKVTGDPEHPANLGRLCSKGSALGETLGLDGRLLTPRVLGQDTDWPAALRYVADGFQRIIADHGPDAVAFYVSGQLLTEDYYVANKLMKGYIGSANIDTNSRLCMSSAVAAHQRAFGEDIVPVSYDDLDLANLIVLVGSNTAWCHPVLFQRIVSAKERRPDLKIVVIDPRATASCEIADLHLPVAAGSDVWLFNGLLHYLHEQGLGDRDFVADHTTGAARALAVAHNTAGSIAAVARRCGLDAAALARFYELFAGSPRVVTLFSQGVNQSSAGTDKANSIINCHLLTGRIGRPGAGPFSITGQPNAMGGREVGGLATMLAAHMEIENAEHRRIVQRFWNSPTIPKRRGLKAVDLFEAVHAGQVKAIWIAGTNPVVSMPNADRARAALSRCELVVISDCVADTDTTALAHVLLPAAAWGEKDGTVTNSERCISRQRSFLPPPGAAKPDWWIFAAVARAMGFTTGFEYSSAHEVFLEHARLSATANDGGRAFNLSDWATLDAASYATLSPRRWGDRPFSDGRFSHADGRARFVAATPRPPAHALDAEYPLVLNTGRLRDQWHTMTRTGKSARLMAHSPEPFVDMHPHDAKAAGVRVGEFVRITTRWGKMVARLHSSGAMPRRMIFVPMHWNDTMSGAARVGALVNPVVDPLSGEPEFKHTPARVSAFEVAWQGFALSRTPLTLEDATYWSRTLGDGFQRYEMAGRRVRGDWSPWAQRLLGAGGKGNGNGNGAPRAGGDWLEYVDRGRGVYRAALVIDNRLQGCLFLSPRPDLPPRSWLSSLFAHDNLTHTDRMGLLQGRPVDASADLGPVVCSCFNVGRNTIAHAIREFSLKSPLEIGKRLRAGTNCGSCIPELKALLAAPEPA